MRYRSAEGDLFPSGEQQRGVVTRQLTLRDYQIETLEGLRRVLRELRDAGKPKWGVLSAPTGAGKTTMACALMQGCKEKGQRSIFVADRNALVGQADDALNAYGMSHGMVQAENTWGLREKMLVTSSQTLEARPPENHPQIWDGIALAVVDECHTIRKKLIEYLRARGIVVIGLTATPMVPGLGLVYGGVFTSHTTYQLIDKGWLAPWRPYIAEATVNMSGQGRPRGVGGEWTDQQAAGGAAEIVCDIPTEWVRKTNEHFGGPVTSLAFVPTVAYGAELVKQFNKLGYKWRQVSYQHSMEENQESIQMLRSGEVHGLVSVEALAKGLDVTNIQYIACARKYNRALAPQIQIIGRGQRAHEWADGSKKECFLFVDHARNLLVHGDSIEEFWRHGCSELDTGKKRETKGSREESKERQCQKCGFYMPRDCPECPRCGHRNERRKSRQTASGGKLKEWVPLAKRVGGDIWPHVCQLGVEKHPDDQEKALKFALAQYRNITGQWPPWQGGHKRNLEPNGHCDPDVRKAAVKGFRKWVRQKRKEEAAKEQEQGVA